MKFTFTAEDDDDYKNELTFREETWPDILPRFLEFLRGCGYDIEQYAELNINMNCAKTAVRYDE